MLSPELSPDRRFDGRLVEIHLGSRIVPACRIDWCTTELTGVPLDAPY